MFEKVLKYSFVLVLLFAASALAQSNESYLPSKLVKLKSQVPEEWFIDSMVNFCNHTVYSKSDTTLRLYAKAISFYHEQRDSCKLSYVYANRGALYERKNYADSATQDFVFAKEYFNKDCSLKTHYLLYLNWGILYLDRDEFALCDSLSQIALQDARKLKAPLLEIDILNNIAISKAQQNKLAEAMKVFRSIYKIAKDNNHKEQFVKAMNNIGTTHAILGNLDSASYYYEKVLLVVDLTNYETRIDVYNNLAGVYSDRGLITKAYNAFNKALSLAEESGDLVMQSKILKNYAWFENEQGNNEKAFEFINRHLDLYESLQSAAKVRAIREIEEKYQSAERLRKIASLEKKALENKLAFEKEKKDKFISVGIGLLIVLLAISLWGRLLIIKKSKTEIQKAKKQSDDLLLNILPADVAEELKETGQSKARSFEEVTIMFADIADFTVQAQELSPIQLVEEINTCFKAFDEIVTKYNVEKIKTIGDAYMAASGFSEDDTTSASRITHAALDIQQFMQERKSKTNSSLNFEMRIGLHTGTVVAGIVGVKKFQYDIWGDTVNTASRMESTCEKGMVNISEETYNRIKNNPEFKFINRGKVDVKGKGEMPLYFVSKG